MADVIINDESLKAIGNSIRGKNGKSDLYTPAEMPAAISSISNPSIKLSNIVILTPPTKLVYKVGEAFNPDGMNVQANYSNTAFKDNVVITYSPVGELSIDDTQIQISYEEFGIKKTVIQNITVQV